LCLMQAPVVRGLDPLRRKGETLLPLRSEPDSFLAKQISLMGIENRQ